MICLNTDVFYKLQNILKNIQQITKLYNKLVYNIIFKLNFNYL